MSRAVVSELGAGVYSCNEYLRAQPTLLDDYVAGPTRSGGDETRRPVVMEGLQQRAKEKEKKRDNRYIRGYSPAALDEICQTTGGSQFVLVRVLTTLKEP